MNQASSSGWKFWSVVASLAGVGAMLVLLATPLGTGVTPDSINYLEGARHLGAGRGYVSASRVTEAGQLMMGHGYLPGDATELEPITHWPPFYSFVLAGASVVGGDPWSFSRWLNALLLGANIVGVAWMARRFGRASVVGACFAGFLLLTSWQFLTSHVYALSEPLFTTLMLAALTGLLRHLEKPCWPALGGAAVALGLAMLCRYFALPLIATGALSLLLYSRSSFGRRVLEAAVFSVVGLVGFVAFSLRNRAIAGATVDMPISFQGAPASFFADLLSELYLGFFPKMLPTSWYAVVAGGVLLLILAGASIVVVGRSLRGGGERDVVPAVLGWFAGAYLAFLVFGVLFISLQMRWEIRRYLAPLQPLCILFVTGFLTRGGWGGPWRRCLSCVGLCLAIALGTVNAVRAGKWLVVTRADGQQYASRTWQDSATLAWLAQSPTNAVLFSNGYDVIPFFAGRPARPAPIEWNPVNERPVANTNEQFQFVRDQLRAGDGRVVWFTGSRRRYMTPVDRLQQELGLVVVTNLADGVILRAGTSR